MYRVSHLARGLCPYVEETLKIHKIPREGYDVRLTMSARELQCLLSVANCQAQVVDVVAAHNKERSGDLYDIPAQEIHEALQAIWHEGRPLLIVTGKH